MLQNALANRKRTVTERGSSDPLTGEFTYDPDYEITLEQNKLDTLHKLKTAADLRHDADERDAALRRELQGVRDAAAAERAALVGAGKVGGIGAEVGRTYAVEDRMADDFNREIAKQHKTVSNYKNLQGLASMGNPMSDVALVFNYMKVLDPESVVKADEQAQVSNAAGVPERVRNLWNSVFSGVRLSEKQRQEVLAAAGAYAETAEAHISGATRSYNDRAKRRGLSTLQVTGTPDDDMPTTPAPRARGGAAPAPAAPGKKAPVRVNY